ncbi:hypothetical protein BDZ89DRAFT_1062059 [Hymenopellis radicata]|nr:hypothetical protein BDZ89DRAFT_1062059 [Hymenopellis radicata]
MGYTLYTARDLLMAVSLTPHRSKPHLLLSILSQTTKLAMLQLEASMLHFREDDPFHEYGTPDDWSVTQMLDVMRALEVVPGHTVTFLPRLVSLDIRLSKLEKFHFGLRTTFLDDRNRPEMYKLRIHEALFHGHDTSALRGLCEDGMDLIIQFDSIRGFDL